MSPPNDNVPSRVELDLQAHSKSITVIVEDLNEVRQAVAIITAENKYRDEKLTSITSLGRTVLLAVIMLFLGAVFAYLAAGGFRVPPVT